jgi:NodT family efflux transporter outer membrane factor (OMF) lipoprotein
MLRIHFLIGLFAVLLSGCVYLRRHETPVIANTPPDYLSAPVATFIDEPWWPAFQDSTLTRLIEDALASSPTMDIALARMEQLQAAYRYVAASRLPSVSTSGTVHTGDQQLVERYNDNFRTTSVRANTVYEIDFWQKLSSNRRRAAAELIASRNDAYTSVMALTSQVARTYYTLVRVRAELTLLHNAEAAYVEDSIAVQTRNTFNPVTSPDYYQTLHSLAQTRALIELTAVSLDTEEHALAILLGHYPRTSLNMAVDTLVHGLDTIRAGLPAELLQRRPDIQAARARLAAADYGWAEAYAERFPSFSLTGSGGNVSHDLIDAINPAKMTLSIATGLTLPIFEGGRLKAQYEGAGAAFREVAANYTNTVLNAFREVEDALTLGRHQVDVIHQLELAQAAADSSLAVANREYHNGTGDHLSVAMAQTTSLDAARNVITARFDLLTYRIDLATALGGSWTEDAVEKYARTRGPVPLEKK